MTIEQILECDAATLKAMPDAVCLKHFESFLKVTRPELAPRPKKATVQSAPMDFAMKQKLAKLQALGIDCDFMKKGKR